MLKTTKYLLGFAVLALFVGLSNQSAYAVSFVDVPLTGTLNTNDFPYGIECSDDTYVYMTVFQQGALARIHKQTLATQIIPDNENNASGEDFYSISRNPNNGDLLINKADKGEVSVYHTSSSTWNKYPIIQEVVHASISYPSTYQGQPNLIKVTAEPIHGDHTYQFGISSRGESKFTNGNFWVLLDDVRDFDANAESLGISDISFHGIVKINPTTFTATRIAVSGTSMDGLAIDSVDSTILWITSKTDAKLFKFDTNTNTVTQTVSLPVGSAPRGLVTDSSYVYIAMNKAGGSGENSKILKVDKSNTSTQTIIDTTASNTSTGTFALMRVGTYLGWSDESGHVGLINLDTGSSITVVNTTNITSNRFACTPDNGNTIWFAGHGSVKSTILDIPSDSSSDGTNGDGNQFNSRPTMGKSHQTGYQLVDYGFFHNNKKYPITDNFYTPTEKITIVTGELNSFGLKTFVGDAQVMVGEISLVPEIGAFHKAEVRLESYFNFDKTLKEIKVIQQDNVIDKSIITSYQMPVDCVENSKRNDCIYIGWDNVVFVEKPIFEKVALNIINDNRRYHITYLNDGFSFEGKDSYNAPITTNAVVERGQLEELTRIDKRENLWQNESNVIYKQNDFGTFIRQSPYVMTFSNDIPQNVMTRNHSDFDELISYSLHRAMKEFDSSLIQGKNKGFIASPDPGIDHREETLKKLSWNQ